MKDPTTTAPGSGPAPCPCSKPKQRDDGSLAFHPARELRETFSEPAGESISGTRLSAPDGYADLLSQEDAPDAFRVVARFHIAENTTECGVLLRASADGDEGYSLRLEPKRGRLVFDRWPRRMTGTEQWQISGDVPHAIELERPVTLEPGDHELEVIVDGDICVATVDNCTVLSTRIYNRPAAVWAYSSARETSPSPSFPCSRAGVPRATSCRRAPCSPQQLSPAPLPAPLKQSINGDSDHAHHQTQHRLPGRRRGRHAGPGQLLGLGRQHRT